MEATNLIVFLLIGAVAGWLAGLLMLGGGFGAARQHCRRCHWRRHRRVPVRPGRYLCPGGGLAGSLITAIAGSAVLLFIVGLVKSVLIEDHHPLPVFHRCFPTMECVSLITEN